MSADRLSSQESAEAPFLKLRKVTSENILKAARLAESVFPYEVGRTPYEAFEASLDPAIMQEKFPNNALMEYWALESESNDVVAITGIYEKKADRDEAAWLAWTCVDPQFRGRGTGRQLVLEVEAEARKRGKSFLRLFTSDHPNEAIARALYLDLGFVVRKTDDEPVTYRDGVSALTVYMEKRLDPVMQAPLEEQRQQERRRILTASGITIDL